MAADHLINTLRLSLTISLPLLVDLAYHEGYLVPATIPNFYNPTRLNQLAKPTLFPACVPPSLTFVRYRTENPLHAQYIHAKKSFWRYNAIWPALGVITSGLQTNHLIRSLRSGRPLGAIAALSAITLTWGTIMMEGNARKMYIDEMYQRVLQEEEVY